MLNPGLPQACPDLLAAGGEHVVVQLNLCMMGESDVTVKSWLDCLSPGVGPTLPKVYPQEKSDDEFPHCHYSLDANAM